ncbi:Myotubularin-related protein 14 [Mactra antiquata]
MTEDSTPLVVADEIHHLLEHFSRNSYRVKGDQKVDPVTEKCLKLLKKDYQISIINNTNGELCQHYPSKLALLEYEKSPEVHERVESMYDTNKVKELFKQARFARCRSRFVVPVILYDGKHICRSATLSSGAEMYSRSGLDFFFTGSEQSTSSASKSLPADQSTDMQMFDRVRGQDINLLKNFSVKYIIDLMVEKKKVKFLMNVTSSEKVDKENRYGEFCIVSVPYPGCEFFKEWKDKSYQGEGIKFDWSQSFVDARLDIPPTEILKQLHIDWTQYKHWNLIQITQNYLKMILHVLKEGDKGVLVHCISGWDRTPMFISLLRLSLWADGAIHKSLNPTEIVYLTLAYDWYLFGHNLSDRLNKGEEILFFCFYFLSNITSDEYSIHSTKLRTTNTNHTETTNMNGLIKPQDNSHHGARRPYNGSSSSLGSLLGRRRTPSNGSVSSNSSLSGSPFNISVDDDTNLPNCSSQQDSFPNVVNPGHLQRPLIFQRSSSPIEVQSTRGRQPSMSESPTCGSWQVISSTGSLLSSEFHASSSQHSSRFNSCEEVTECDIIPERSERWEKLDCVRRIFHNAYQNKITTKFRNDSGITNVLDQFAEKFGFKQSKGFF